MRASSVKPRAVEWFWQPFIPLGKLTDTAGQMGQAKSLFTMLLAERATSAGGSAVMLSAEDDAEDTIRPRLEAAGADLDRVEIRTDATLNAVELGETCDELGDVKLITIDPIQAFLPATVNSWKGQDVRIALEPLRQLVAERRVACVLIQHLNRRADGDALARIADSQGIPQLCRSVTIWGPDPSDPEGDHGRSKVLSRAKANLARNDGTSATFTIVERQVSGGILAPALVQGADSRIAADDVIADRETRSARDEATDWLRALLADGPVAAKDAQRRARDEGIAERTLRRAKASLGVISEQSREGDSITGWTWRLPDSPPAYSNGHLGYVGHVGHLDQVAKEAKKAKKANTYEQATLEATELTPRPGESFEDWSRRADAYPLSDALAEATP